MARLVMLASRAVLLAVPLILVARWRNGVNIPFKRVAHATVWLFAPFRHVVLVFWNAADCADSSHAICSGTATRIANPVALLADLTL